MAWEPTDAIAQRLGTILVDGKVKGTLDARLKRRNASLMAHGFALIGETGWQEVEGWMRRHWLDVVWPELGAMDRLPQLPITF